MDGCFICTAAFIHRKCCVFNEWQRCESSAATQRTCVDGGREAFVTARAKWLILSEKSKFEKPDYSTKAMFSVKFGADGCAERAGLHISTKAWNWPTPLARNYLTALYGQNCQS